VLLLASELATNAVVHAGTAFHVTAIRQARSIRVEIFDSARAQPRVCTPGPYDESGRGIQLVEHLASRWGCEPRAGGKAVWFEVPSRGASAVSA